MKPSELPGTRSLYRLTNRALIKIRELWQYSGEDELPPDSLLQAQVEALRILHIDGSGVTDIAVECRRKNGSIGTETDPESESRSWRLEKLLIGAPKTVSNKRIDSHFD
jgi:hypothetical protein